MEQKHSNNRLLKLADYLEKLPSKAIDMDAWLTDNHGAYDRSVMTTVERLGDLAKVKGNKIQLKSTDVHKIRTCGFAACAVGWACTIPSFRKAGLRLTATLDNKFMMIPKFDGQTGFEAVEEFFGITGNTASYLFESDAYGQSGKPRPKTVANRIRKVVRRREAGKTEVPASSIYSR
jgi:hypothetical protein